MQKISFFIVLLLVTVKTEVAFSQNRNNDTHGEAVITYGYKSNGKEIPGKTLKLAFKKGKAYLTEGDIRTSLETRAIDYLKQQTLQTLRTREGDIYTLRKSFSKYEKAELTGDTASILGISCQKARLVIRSNTIEVWFTNKLAIKGSPSLGIAPGLGLILKTLRNGNFETFARSIDYGHVPDSLWTKEEQLGKIVDEAGFRRKEMDNRYFRFPIFNRQQINFTDSIVNPAPNQEAVTYRYAGGTVVLKKVKLPEKGDFHVFARLSQFANGDAYDRTGTVFVIPANKEKSFLNGITGGINELPIYRDKNQKEYQGVVATEDYSPALELMRFFTPFGVGAYNQQVKIEGYPWADSVIYKQDITDLLPALRGEVWIGAFIGNYDKAGHTVNLELDYYPVEEEPSLPAYWIAPIFNTVNILEMAGQAYGTMFDRDSLTVSVDIPKNVKDLQLRYIATGHGGWDGGDEFNQKVNEIILDGKSIYHFVPWRTDCATYRYYNPSSGNFSDGLSSSDLSRSNWCPGTTTNPVYIPVPHLSAGRHTFKVAIPLGKPEGTSFSAWNISGVLIGKIENE